MLCVMFTDVTVGAWMLAMNVTHFDDRRICETACVETTLAVTVSDPVKELPNLHADPNCHSPVLNSEGVIPDLAPYFLFHREHMRVPLGHAKQKLR